MSPHTDPGALLPCPFCGSSSVDPEGWMSCEPDGSDKRTGPACDDCGASAESDERWNTRDWADDARQAASQGNAGGDWEHVRSALETLSDPLKIAVEGHLTGVTRSLAIINGMSSIAKTAALHVPTVKTGGEVEASNGGTTYSPIGRNADGIEVYKRDARPVDVWAREEIARIIDPNFPFWEFAVPNSFQQKRKNRALAKADAILALPKLTAAGESDRYKVDDLWCRPGAAQASWTPPEATPDVKPGNEKEFIVAVYRAHSDKVYTFACSYLNTSRIQYEECPKENRVGFCDGCDDGCPTTGWFRLTGDDSNESGCYQSLDLRDGDKLAGWQPLPKWTVAVPSAHQSAPWDAHHNRSYEPVETRAKEIYDFFEYKDVGTKPAWVPGGNSLMQDEARICARKQLRESGHTPAHTSTDGKSL